MENQVIQLKKKIKELQKVLCERTRNYLYHFKKSPSKKCHSTTDQETQTQPNDQVTQDQTQTSFFPQDNCFAKVDLGNFNKNSSNFSNIDQSEQIQQKKVKSSVFPLDLNNQNIQQGSQSKYSKPFEIVTQQLGDKVDIDNLALEIKLMKEQLQNSKTPRNKQQMKFEFLQSNSILSTPSKDTSNGLMQFSKKRQFDTIEEETHMKFNSESNQKTIQCDHLSKQNKIMKKQIKKLKSLLEHEVQASSQTKAALLISQQENYRFRLKIQRLNKQIQILTGASTDSDMQKYEKPLIFEGQEPALSSIDSEKSQSTKEQLQKFKSHAQKYQQHIFILEGVKRDYLKKCIQAKEQIFKLKQENQKLKGQIQRLKNLIGDTESITQPITKKSKEDSNWEQEVRWKIHEISNCLPVGENQELCLFKPDTGEDSIKVLQRILNFCENIEEWQRQKIQRIEKERANLLKVISGVLMRHPETKQAMAEQILQIEELKYLVNFLNKEPKSNKLSRVLNSFNSCQEFTTNQVSPIEIK